MAELFYKLTKSIQGFPFFFFFELSPIPKKDLLFCWKNRDLPTTDSLPKMPTITRRDQAKARSSELNLSLPQDW